ncbi:MAG TPA: hypothetical protein VHE55_02120 [Fimbriimonadaceae bacterium]|nr:hypothetical protein [Fimbriimonadaceae bacterium]
MKKQRLWIAAGLAAIASMGAIQGCAKANAQESSQTSAQREIQLTIYKEDFALVHETRPVELEQGANHVRMESVSKTLDPNTVMFDWQGMQQAPDVTSQQYDLGVANGGSLLKRLEGKPVEMYWNSQDGKPGDRVDGTLEASSDGGFVLRSGDKLYVNPNGTIVASGDQSLVTMPQLSAQIQSPAKQEAKLGFAYQTRGMSWSSDYVGRLTPDGDALQFECWATLENHTGIDYPNAKITLVAGSTNRAAVPRGQYELAKQSSGDAATDSTGINQSSSRFAPEAVGELYAYKVPAAANVGQEQMNRVKMIATTRVPIKRDYSIRVDNAGYYDSGYYQQNPQHQNAQLAISFVNDEQSGLGMPLPAGAVRIYDDASTDSTAFVGAAGIGDTAKNQHVDLTLSKVFDVYSDSRTAKTEKVDKHTVRRTFETVIHNEKKAGVDVRIVESFYGKKHWVSESDKGIQLNSNTRQWTIHVDAGSQKTLTWTADFGW